MDGMKLFLKTVLLVVFAIIWFPIAVILDVSKHYK